MVLRDRSAYYKTHDNFFPFSVGGLKSDFGGHDNHHYGNVYGYVGSGPHVCATLEAGLTGLPPKEEPAQVACRT